MGSARLSTTGDLIESVSECFEHFEYIARDGAFVTAAFWVKYKVAEGRFRTWKTIAEVTGIDQVPLPPQHTTGRSKETRSPRTETKVDNEDIHAAIQKHLEAVASFLRAALKDGERSQRETVLRTRDSDHTQKSSKAQLQERRVADERALRALFAKLSGAADHVTSLEDLVPETLLHSAQENLRTIREDELVMLDAKPEEEEQDEWEEEVEGFEDDEPPPARRTPRRQKAQFKALISVQTRRGDRKLIPVRGDYDTHRDANFIRYSLVKSEGLSDCIEHLDRKAAELETDYPTSRLKGKISLSWYDGRDVETATKQRTEFFVARDEDFHRDFDRMDRSHFIIGVPTDSDDAWEEGYERFSCEPRLTFRLKNPPKAVGQQAAEIARSREQYERAFAEEKAILELEKQQRAARRARGTQNQTALAVTTNGSP